MDFASLPVFFVDIAYFTGEHELNGILVPIQSPGFIRPIHIIELE